MPIFFLWCWKAILISHQDSIGFVHGRLIIADAKTTYSCWTSCNNSSIIFPVVGCFWGWESSKKALPWREHVTFNAKRIPLDVDVHLSQMDQKLLHRKYWMWKSSIYTLLDLLDLVHIFLIGVMHKECFGMSKQDARWEIFPLPPDIFW